MRALLALLLLVGPSSAGVWTRTGPETMRFEGGIDSGEYDRFAAVFGGGIRELVIVNSGGGRTDEGIRIGLALAAQSVKVTVTGECLSSCANYIFVSGHQREIRGGVVGYHGNVKACFDSPAQRVKEIEVMRNRDRMSEVDIERSMKKRDRKISDEARLLRMMGVSQELFDRTCTEDMGMGDGKSYEYLLPKRATFEKCGLWGIIGEQGPALMKTLRWPFAHD